MISPLRTAFFALALVAAPLADAGTTVQQIFAVCEADLLAAFVRTTVTSTITRVRNTVTTSTTTQPATFTVTTTSYDSTVTVPTTSTVFTTVYTTEAP